MVSEVTTEVTADPHPATKLLLKQDYLLLAIDGSKKKVISLGAKRYSIGREEKRDIQFSSQGVSRYHATLYWFNNQYWIADGDTEGQFSKNGLYVNGERIKRSALKAGDIITFCSGVQAKVTVRVQPPKPGRQRDKVTYLPNHSRPTNPELLANRASSLLQAFPDLIVQLDASGLIINLKESFDPDLAWFSKSFLQTNITSLIPSAGDEILRLVNLVAETRQLQTLDCELCYGPHSVVCEIRLVPSHAGEVVGIFRNVTEQKSLEQKLLKDAAHDSLTGLPNRNFFMERVSQSIHLKRCNENYQFAILFIDLDRFKVINDSLGHLIGDQLLIQIAAKLKTGLRPHDTIARLGGDEFAILLHSIQHQEDAIEIANRLQTELSQPLLLENNEVFPSASIGIAFSEIDYENVEEVLRDADTAMYRAKALGRSRYEIFDREMHQNALSVLQLDSALRRAIERQEFVLHYQPIVNLETQKVIGFESLVRWMHPEDGLQQPDKFIPQAEETGLIVPIGEWALEESCRQLQAWQKILGPKSPLTLNVNISSKQFAYPGLTQQVERLLQQYGLEPRHLKLEVTESTVMENSRSSQEIFASLKRLGIQICIDDFGTGYSSLSYLHCFPIDALKIDRSFITEMDGESTSTGFTIIQSIIGLAHNLGVKVIAEGIERSRHVAWLRAFQCDYGQGYFFAAPLDATKATELIQNGLKIVI